MMTDKETIENLKCVIADISEQCNELKAENAALRERLEKSVERLKAREKSVCLGTEWKAVVTDEDIDEVFGIAEARLDELKGEKNKER